jgi:hypothetical protein
MRYRLIQKEKEIMMRLKNGILTVGGIEFKVEGVSVSDNVNGQILDTLDEILSVARAAHRNLWSKAEVREALIGAYADLVREANPFRNLPWALSRRADELAPYWSLHLEGLTHDLLTEDDEIPWDDDEEPATERPGTEEIREKISDLLIAPRQAVPFASISHHILSNQEEGCWVEQGPHLLGTYADSFDRCLVVGLPTRDHAEWAWFNNGYGGLDEDELEVLVEFLALMMAASRHWGPLTVGKIEEEVSQMAMIAWKDLAERWHEGPVGALVEDYLRGGPVRKAASQAARIPHRI